MLRARRRWILWGIAACALVFAGGCSVAAHFLTRAHPRTIGSVPADLPQAEEWEIPYRADGDDVDSVMHGWWVAASAPGPTVLLLHGWKESRWQMVPRARLLLQHGYSVFVPDLPAHGESDGDFVSFGLREGAAARAAAERLRAHRPGQPIAGLGTSLGGVALLMARCEPPLDAYVVESAFATLEGAVDARLRRVLGFPGPWLTPGLDAFVRKLRGFAADDVRPLDAIAELHRPILLIHGNEDRSTPIEDSHALARAAVHAEVHAWWIEGMGHRDAYGHQGAEYEERLLAFLHATVGPPGSARED